MDSVKRGWFSMVERVRSYIETSKAEADALEAKWFPSRPEIVQRHLTAEDVSARNRIAVRLLMNQDDQPRLMDRFTAYERMVYDTFMADAKAAYEVAAWKMADVEEDIAIANRAGGLSEVLREDHRQASWDLDRACDALVACNADWMHRKHVILSTPRGL
jgi:hypothetical protein